MGEVAPTTEQRQALRLKRFLMASSTYVLGFGFLAMCVELDLLEPSQLLIIGASFLVANLVFFAALASGANLRMRDPSMTTLQICAGVTQVFLILVLGEKLHFLAGPFYSVLFVFGMLRLRGRALLGVLAYMLATYALAVALRIQSSMASSTCASRR